MTVENRGVLGAKPERWIAQTDFDNDEAVGYLADGTMVVVERADQFIGQQIQAIVTSLIQTAAGKMIFARRLKAHGEPDLTGEYESLEAPPSTGEQR